jgi:flagellin-specific chaperone FliS
MGDEEKSFDITLSLSEIGMVIEMLEEYYAELAEAQGEISDNMRRLIMLQNDIFANKIENLTNDLAQSGEILKSLKNIWDKLIKVVNVEG